MIPLIIIIDYGPLWILKYAYVMLFSPASRLSLVFFQITSKALAVESLIWSLNDLLRGAFTGWCIMQIDHTSRVKCCSLAPGKRAFFARGSVWISLRQAGRLLLYIICHQPCGAFPWRVRHCSSHCGCRKLRLQPAYWKAAKILHLEQFTNELTIQSFRFGALFVDIYRILASCLIK